MVGTKTNDESPTKDGRKLEDGYKVDEAGKIVPDYDHTIKFFEDGDVVKGKVVRVDRDEVLVDVGYKSEGVIPIKELSIRRNVNPEEVVKVDSEILVYVLQKEDSEGRLVLSKKRAEYEKAWDNIEEAYKEHKFVKGTVIEIVKGGLILDIGVRGFLPASLVDVNRVKDLNEFVGKEFECKIIEFNRFRNNVVLSRKAVMQGEKHGEKSEIISKISVGQELKGKISSIVDFGAFVDLGGTDGLIHISELSWSHIDHPSEIVKVGDEVKVQVLDIDKRKNRVSLGLKQTQEDTWKKSIKNLKVNDKYKAKVTRILPFGVFVYLDDNIEGLIHVSELSVKKVENPHKVVEVGDEVEVRLLSIDEERRRISLSLKEETKEIEKVDKIDKVEKTEDKKEEKTERTEEKDKKTEKIDDIEKDEKEKAEEAKKDKKTKEDKKEEKTEITEEKDTKKEIVEIKEEEKDKKKKKEAVSADKQVKEEKAEKDTKEEDKKEEKKEIKIKPAEEKLKEELEKEALEEEKEKKKLKSLSKGLDEDDEDDTGDSGKLEDVLEQMKKKRGSKE